MSSLHHPDLSLELGGDRVHLTPERAGWTYTGLRVIELGEGEEVEIGSDSEEMVVLPLSAQRLTVLAGAERFLLGGRTSVFSRVTDFAYIGRGSAATVTSETGGQVAVPSARCDRSFDSEYGDAGEVAVEVRGGGSATRQITNFLSPQRWDHADKLMCVEVLTPEGNWSSYPPHKHDDSPECEANNEEIYYFRIGDAGTEDYSKQGFGMHRTYTSDGDIDESVAVADGDVFLVPRGYHGPCIAAPGYDMYYLNVLAGPGEIRSMAFCDDPAHHWIRSTWDENSLDPRCPMTTAGGKTFREANR